MSRARTFIVRYFPVLVIVGTFSWACIDIYTRGVEEQPEDVTVIRIAHWQLEPAVREAFEEMGRRYQALHPDVRIKQEAIPEGIYGTWVTTQVVGGTAPDLIEIGMGLLPQIWVSYFHRYFEPLTRKANQANPYNANTPLENVPFRQTFKDDMRLGYSAELAEYMYVPLSMFGVRLFYNKDLLKTLTGLDEAPTEYRAFLEACERIKAHTGPNGQLYVPIASSRWHFWHYQEWMFDPLTYSVMRLADFNRDGLVGNEELFVALRTRRVTWEHPAVHARFQMVREVSNYFQPGWTGLTRDEAVFLFIQQRAVFMTTGTWDVQSLIEQSEGLFEVGLMDFPIPSKDDPVYGDILEGPRYAVPAAGFGFGVTRSERSDIAFDFLQFLTSQEGNEELNSLIGWIPSIRGAKTTELLEKFSPNLDGVYGAFSFLNAAIQGNSATRFQQEYSAYQVKACSYEEMWKKYQAFYDEHGEQDYLETQKDWRRDRIGEQRHLIWLRSKAMAQKTEEDAMPFWMKYRKLTWDRLIWAEVAHNGGIALVKQGPAPDAPGPYEYGPYAMKRIRERVKASLEDQAEEVSVP